MDIRHCTFHGEKFLLIPDSMGGAAIATEHQYENMEESFAHVYDDGRVLRHHVQIGTREDIVVGDLAKDFNE